MSSLLADHWLQSIHENRKGVYHAHGQNPQLQVMEALDVVLYRASLAQFLQLLPCLLLLCDGREGRGYFLSEVMPIRLGCLITYMGTGVLRPKLVAGTLLQPSTSKFNPRVWSAWGQLQLVCSLFTPILDSGESFTNELH